MAAVEVTFIWGKRGFGLLDPDCSCRAGLHLCRGFDGALSRVRMPMSAAGDRATHLAHFLARSQAWPP